MKKEKIVVLKSFQIGLGGWDFIINGVYPKTT